MGLRAALRQRLGPQHLLHRLAALPLRPLGLVSRHRLELGFLGVLGLVSLPLRPLALALRPRLVLDPPESLGAGLGALVVGQQLYRLGAPPPGAPAPPALLK